MNDCARHRVLIVDDEVPVCRSLCGFLEDHDFEVVACGSAEEALDRCQVQPCDVAVVDMRLPGMDGDSLILELHHAAPGTRFLIYTGSVDYQLSEELQRVGLKQAHVLRKPLEDLSILVEHIRVLLDERENAHDR